MEKQHISNAELLFCHFHKAKVQLVIVGGQAEVLHGSSRVTVGTDICYEPSGANLRRLSKSLGPLNPTAIDQPPNLHLHVDENVLRLSRKLALDTILGPLKLLACTAPFDSYKIVRQNAIPLN